jgi:hypothetical protein
MRAFYWSMDGIGCQDGWRVVRADADLYIPPQRGGPEIEKGSGFAISGHDVVRSDVTDALRDVGASGLGVTAQHICLGCAPWEERK